MECYSYFQQPPNANNNEQKHLLGWNFDTIEWLESLLSRIYHKYSPFALFESRVISIYCNRGRHYFMTSRDCLGLCLSWIRTRSCLYILHIVFRMTGLSISTYLQFGCCGLIMLLQPHLHAAIKPSEAKKIAEYQLILYCQLFYIGSST
jgi:hypothetical protein